MSGLGRPFLYDRNRPAILAYLAVILAMPQRALAWGRKGRQIIVVLAEHYVCPETATRVRELVALLFVGGKVQSEILRAVYPERAERDSSLRSAALRMTAWQASTQMSG